MSLVSGPGAIGGPGYASLGRLRSLRDVEPQRGFSLEPASGAREADFGATLSDVLSEVNDLQLHSEDMLEQFAAGQVEHLHDVVIAQQEASIAMKLVQEMRDKLLQAYQEFMRMQV